MMAILLHIFYLCQLNDSGLNTYREKSTGCTSLIPLLIPRANQSSLFFALIENSFLYVILQRWIIHLFSLDNLYDVKGNADYLLYVPLFEFITEGVKIMTEISVTLLYFWKRDSNLVTLNMKYMSLKHLLWYSLILGTVLNPRISSLYRGSHCRIGY